MTRVMDPTFQTYLDNNTKYNIAKCYRIVRKDGVQHGWTEHDADITKDLGDGKGSLVYKASSLIDTTDIENKVSLGSSNMDLTTILFEDDSIDVEAVLTGQYGNAEFDCFEVIWSEPSLPVNRLFCGLISTAEVNDNLINITFRSFMGLYDQTITRLVKRGCGYELGRHSFGFHRCWVNMDANPWQASTSYTKRLVHDAKSEVGGVIRPSNAAHKYWFKCNNTGTSGTVEPAWPTGLGATVNDNGIIWKAIRARKLPGTITAVTDNSRFTASGIDLVADHWKFGRIQWLTGSNAGLSVEVIADNGSGVIELFESMAADVKVGDTFNIFAGCDRLKPTCISKFDNVYWFGGFDDAPGILELFQTPDVKSS